MLAGVEGTCGASLVRNMGPQQGSASMAGLGCLSRVAATAGGQGWEEPGAPGAKATRMSPLPGRRAGNGALSLYSSNPMLCAKGESSQDFLSLQPSREPSGVRGTVEMSWVVWGEDAVGEDEERAGFLSISLAEVATSCQLLPAGVGVLVD